MLGNQVGLPQASTTVHALSRWCTHTQGSQGEPNMTDPQLLVPHFHGDHYLL